MRFLLSPNMVYISALLKALEHLNDPNEAGRVLISTEIEGILHFRHISSNREVIVYSKSLNNKLLVKLVTDSVNVGFTTNSYPKDTNVRTIALDI